MKKIYVEQERLINCANNVDDLNMEFQRLKGTLLEKVETLSSSWSGKDNQAFVSEITEYGTVMNSMSTIMNQYADFLRNSANAYQRTQEEVYNEALKIRRT